MTLLETAAVAFAMFSAVPVPQPVWNEKNMRYALCAFPLVGVVCGLAWWGWAALAARLSFPLLRARPAVPCASARDRGHPPGRLRRHLRCAGKLRRAGKKAEDIKGPALRRVCGHTPVHLFYGLSGPVRGGGLHAPGCAVHGAGLCAGAGAFRLCDRGVPSGKKHGLAHSLLQREQTARLCARALLDTVRTGRRRHGGGGGDDGAAMALAAVLVFLRYRAVAQKQFGGISGDLAGWFLQKAELWMLAALAACSLLSGVTG